MRMAPAQGEIDRKLSLLEAYLDQYDVPCPLCGYSLHKLRGSACPECGNKIELQIRASHPRLAAFYTGLVGLAAGVGFTTMVLLYAVFTFVSNGYLPGPSIDILVLIVEAGILSTMLFVWIRFSGRIRRMRGIVRWALAIGAWVLTVTATFIFFWVAG